MLCWKRTNKRDVGWSIRAQRETKMKTYTKDEIIKEASGRPEVVFTSDDGFLQKYDKQGRLLLGEIDGGWTLDETGLSEKTTYTIPADNEKPVEPPKSVRDQIRKHLGGGRCWVDDLIEALWAETVKLVEAGKK